MAGDTIVVEPELRKVLQSDDDCDVIFHWRGKWRSDFFHFKIRDLRAYIESHPVREGAGGEVAMTQYQARS